MGASWHMAKVTTKGQITIPAAIRKALGIKTGDKVLFVEKGNGRLRSRMRRSSLSRMRSGLS